MRKETNTAIPTVFKYMESQYLKDFISGSIYLNSFSNIRSMEELKQQQLIGDVHEGLNIHNTGNLFLNSNDLSHADKIKKFKQISGDRGFSGTLWSVGTTYIQQLNDAWMFCATTERNDEFWLAESGYDCCVEINHPEVFFHSIHNALSKLKGNIESYAGTCTYEEIIGELSDDFECIKQPSYFRKANIFKPQSELRAIYNPRKNDRPLAPLKVTINPKGLFSVLGFRFYKLAAN